MGNRVKYIFLSLIRNKISFLLLVIQFTSSFILINMAIDMSRQLNKESEKAENLFSENDIYGVINDQGRGNKNDFSNEDLNYLYKFLNEIENTKFVSFHKTRVPINGVETIGEEQQGYHGNPEILIDGKIATANYIDVLKFDENTLEYIEFPISEGKFFEKGKMYIDDYVPVVLGGNFTGIHNIGDIMYCENPAIIDEKLNLNSSIKLKVIGILKSNVEMPLITIKDSGRFENIDSSIMIPYFTDKAINLDKAFFEYNIETEKKITSGTLLTQKDISPKVVLQNLNQSQEIINFDLLDVKERFSTKISILKMQKKAYIELGGIIIIFSTIGTVMILLSIIKKSLKEYSIHLLSGASIESISEVILGQIIFVLIFSIFLTFLSMNTISMYAEEGVYRFNFINLLIAMIVGLITWIIPKEYIKRMGIIKIIKGEY
ncbi:MAG: hypothetical protein ACRC6T_05910 [Sarcina sp.]